MRAARSKAVAWRSSPGHNSIYRLYISNLRPVQDAAPLLSQSPPKRGRRKNARAHRRRRGQAFAPARDRGFLAEVGRPNPRASRGSPSTTISVRRRALLEAVFDDRAASGGLHRIPEAMAEPDPHRALERLIAIFSEFWSFDQGRDRAPSRRRQQRRRIRGRHPRPQRARGSDRTLSDSLRQSRRGDRSDAGALTDQCLDGTMLTAARPC